jgi:outer membrane protein assembly factor BamE (lipoprotein component of BamABCDE complex)
MIVKIFKKISILSVVVGIITSTGCVRTGNEVVASMNRQDAVNVLTIGRTNSREVADIFGRPSKIEHLSNGRSKWIYRHVTRTPKVTAFIPVVSAYKNGSYDTSKKFSIVFDKNGVVEQHYFATIKGETSTGLLG